MVDAVSLSGNGYRAASLAGPRATADARPAAAAALAVLTPSPAVTQVTTPSDTAEAIGDLGFLYGASGRPEGAALPSRAVFSAQPASETAERTPGSRLAVNSGDLDALFASLMTRGQTEAPAPQSTGGSLIAQFYSQF